jgi:hypothetical protein
LCRQRPHLQGQMTCVSEEADQTLNDTSLKRLDCVRLSNSPD